MSALTDAIRAHFITCVDNGRFDGEGLDKLLAAVESVQHRAATVETVASDRLPGYTWTTESPEILKGNADLEQPTHDAHVRVMEGREAAHRG